VLEHLLVDLAHRAEGTLCILDEVSWLI
jgi:hypothetical protein